MDEQQKVENNNLTSQTENTSVPQQNNTWAPRKSKMHSTKSGLEEKLIKVKRINKTTKGGRKMRFSALVIVGDRNGNIGYGLGKSVEVPVAIRKATANAEKNVVNVKIDRNGTVYHEVIGKSCASRVLIKPAKKGTGLISGGAIRTIMELAGFKNIYTKILGSSTSINSIRACINALLSQHLPKNIASARDKMVVEL